jgi:hypothetical protein
VNEYTVTHAVAKQELEFCFILGMRPWAPPLTVVAAVQQLKWAEPNIRGTDAVWFGRWRNLASNVRPQDGVAGSSETRRRDCRPGQRYRALVDTFRTTGHNSLNTVQQENVHHKQFRRRAADKAKRPERGTFGPSCKLLLNLASF